jgi:M6 family metalloprotease-like protein
MSAIFGELLTFGQQSGPDIRLRVFGDEHYARYETADGYTVVYDDGMGRFCYARLAAGELRSTGASAEGPPPAGLARHLQEAAPVVNVKSQARKLRRAAISGGRPEEEVVRTFGPNQGLLEGRVLATGPVRGLTILVNFQDITTTVTQADMHEMLNGDNYTRNGNICSAREYFRRVSSGKLDYTNVVVGPYTLSRNRQFYVTNLLVEEALTLAVADGLDLTQFDSRHEGIIDALNVLYAGQSQYNGDLWPHNFHIDLQFGAMRTDLYLLTSAGRSPSDLSIGTFCHENGHLLCRFPDMYDYGQRDGDNIPSAGIGMYCLMGAGNHLDSGRSPSPVCSYLRDLVGWCENQIDLTVAGPYQATHGDYNTVIKYPTSRPNEYFIVENRSKMGLDRSLPASGLAIYHCDILGSNELQEGSATKHYQCALLQADGRRDLEMNMNQGDGADLFGLIGGIAVSAESATHSREWDGRDSGLVIADISEPGDAITFGVGAQSQARTVTANAAPIISIPDADPVGISHALTIAESGTVARLKVGIHITHTYVGDLVVSLQSPLGRRAVLHAQLGGPTDNLVANYDSATPGELASLVGQPMKGDWVLSVVDRLALDVGVLRSWSIEITSAPVGEAPAIREARVTEVRERVQPQRAAVVTAPAKRKAGKKPAYRQPTR